MFKERQITSMSLLAYALPAAAFAIPTIPVAIHVPGLYAEDMGLGLAAVGAALLIARFFDIISDPLAGIISDRFPLPWGRRKTWVILGALAAGFGLYRLFSPPAGADINYLLTWSVVLYVGWTFVTVPYNAWGAELSETYDGRTRITTAREACGVIGILVASIAPFLLSYMELDDEASRQGIVWIAFMFGTPALIFLILLVPERPRPPSAKPYFSRASLKAIAKNSLFIRLVTAWFLNGTANALTVILLPLYIKYVLAVPHETRDALIFLYFASAVLALPFCAKLSKRLSKHQSWSVIMTGASLTFLLVPLVGPGDVWLFAIVCAITGAALGADLALPPAMQADVIDIDRLHTHEERAGLFFAFWGMATKLALALAIGCAFPLLDATGFVTDGTTNSPPALMMLMVLYATVPAALKFAAIGLMWNYPLSRKRQEALRRRLSRRPSSPRKRAAA
ncbi:MFS transporter [Govanella unica]|uniref:MFS transporter n=1 Tax=Govanella unica TaxID=2975056 RepID=A0A9X3Z860_9PROT|nr:MFS transporter [Govania unica]MDA5194806.1 MFS transporter [Govania unica]